MYIYICNIYISIKRAEINKTLAGFIRVVPKKERISTRTKIRASHTWSVKIRIELELEIPNRCSKMQLINCFILKCVEKPHSHVPIFFSGQID